MTAGERRDLSAVTTIRKNIARFGDEHKAQESDRCGHPNVTDGYIETETQVRAAVFTAIGVGFDKCDLSVTDVALTEHREIAV